MIYLDYTSHTKMCEEALRVYNFVNENYLGNANSLHFLGTQSRKLLDETLEEFSKLLNVKKNELIFTSSASEANNLALKGLMGKNRKRIITSKHEHKSIIETLTFLNKSGYEIIYLENDEDKKASIKDLEDKINSDTLLITISSVGSETGIKNDIEKIKEIKKKYPGVLLHVDFTQSLGKEKINLDGIDMATFSAHKIYGPLGIGLLFKKENINLVPLIHGGKSITSFRAGTPDLPNIVSFKEALKKALANLEENYNYVKKLSDYFKKRLEEENILINTSTYSLPHIVNISLEKYKSQVWVNILSMKEIYVSASSACSKGEFSYLIKDITKDLKRAESSIRISISHETTREELEEFLKAVKE